MFCISIWKFVSCYEFVSWNCFVWLLSDFCWIVRNYISFFILVWSCYFFVDVFCVTIWKFLSFYESISWYIIFLRCSTFFCWIIWNFFSFFILEWSCYFFVDVFSISIFIFYSFNNFISWNWLRWFFSVFRWDKFCFFSIFSYYYKLSIRANCWCISFRNYFTIFIFNLNCYSRSFPYEVFFWCEFDNTVFK